MLKTLFKKCNYTPAQVGPSLGMEPAGLRIFIYPDDVMRDSKEYQNAKYQKKKAVQGRVSDKQNA